jgi:hypothetical protein
VSRRGVSGGGEGCQLADPLLHPRRRVHV